MTEELEKKIAKLKKGDKKAFDYVYEKTNRPVYFTALYIVKDKSRAEDVLQDTYVRALSRLEQYEAGTNFIGWLCSISKSLALNSLKKYSREVYTDFETDSYKYGTRETELPYVFETARKILPEDEYNIVMLCQVAGYKRREVAEMLGIPIGTVTWKNNQALKKLKDSLEEKL